MEPVAAKVLDGLLEGLVLHALEQEPSHGYGLLKDLEAAIGAEASKNRVYRVLRDLEEEGCVVSEEVTEDSRTRQVYSLTDTGAERLQDYRDLPAPFKTWLSGLFAVSPNGAPTPPAGRERTGDEATGGPEVAEEAWVSQALAALPKDARVRARHAEYALERAPGEAQWRFVVERHDPGAYEGSGECPLTFVYLAIHRLLYGAEP